MNRKSLKPGFTLPEVMIVVAIIGILAMIAVPKLMNLVNRAYEGAAKGNLSRLRSALSIYYSDSDGVSPMGAKQNPSTILQDTLVPKYLTELPYCYVLPNHPKSQRVRSHEHPDAHGHDHGYWAYDANNTSTGWGHAWIICTHDDSKGTPWENY
ncbi:MAG: type II secretion system protein [Elusimicrobia bacterium]|nr:type II secretion system protein [Elusimicrobiota bacterium]